eukprot:4008706-Heterocapsa_arctica.AAC.1
MDFDRLFFHSTKMLYNLSQELKMTTPELNGIAAWRLDMKCCNTLLKRVHCAPFRCLLPHYYSSSEPGIDLHYGIVCDYDSLNYERLTGAPGQMNL